jgi:ATP-dependent Lon protease
MGKFSVFSEDQKDQLLESLEGLYNDAELGPGIQEAIEKKFGVTDPALAQSRRHSAELGELRTQLTSLESKQMEKEIRSRVDSDKSQAQRDFKLSDDEMKEVSKLMMENGIGTYKSAADYYRLQKQAAKPTSSKLVEHSALTLPGDVELFKDRAGWARREAYKAINEIEQNRV